MVALIFIGRAHKNLAQWSDKFPHTKAATLHGEPVLQCTYPESYVFTAQPGTGVSCLFHHFQYRAEGAGSPLLRKEVRGLSVAGTGTAFFFFSEDEQGGQSIKIFPLAC